jgi:hypothetical protein
LGGFNSNSWPHSLCALNLNAKAIQLQISNDNNEDIRMQQPAAGSQQLQIEFSYDRVSLSSSLFPSSPFK